MSAAYDVKTVDLTNAQTVAEIIGPAKQIFSVAVTRFPAGAVASLRLGQSGKDIPVQQQGFSLYDPQGCVIETDGLYITNPAQPGVSVDIMVGFAPLKAGA